jgi:hypothetical protein
VGGDAESKKENRGRKVVGEINSIFQAILATSKNFPLRDSFILDSDNFRRVQLGDQAICGSGLVTIQEYSEIEVALMNPKGQVQFLRLNNVSYCPELPTNLVSLKLLEDRGIDWDHRKRQLQFHGKTEVIGTTKRSHSQYVVSHSENDIYTHKRSIFATTPKNSQYLNKSREKR